MSTVKLEFTKPISSETDNTEEMTSPKVNRKAVMEDPEKRDKFMYDWDRKIGCFACSCFSFTLQVVLLAAMVSLVFGVNISATNTMIGHFSWERHWCDFESPGETITGCTKDTNFQAFISTAQFIGATIGALVSGNLMGFGRRTLLIMSLLVFGLGTISAICANSFSAMFWARLNGGFGIGLSSVAIPAYMSEMCPPSVRGRYGVFHQTFINIGIALATIIGLPLGLGYPVPEEEGPLEEIDVFPMIWWRVMFGLGLLPIVLDFYLLIKVFSFETPHYYIERGYLADAEQLVKLILQKDDVTDELKEIMDEMELAKQAKEAGMSLGQAMGRADYRWVIIFGCLLSAFQQLSGINVHMSISTNLFKDAGLSNDMATVVTVIMAVLNILGTLCAVPMIERFGRRSLLMAGTLFETAALLPAAICYWIDEDAAYTQWLAIVGALLFVIGFAVSYGPVLWVYLFEIYPMEIRGAAAGLATAVNWACGVALVFIGGYVENQILFTIFTVMAGIGAMLVICFMLETKGRVLGDSPYVNRS